MDQPASMDGTASIDGTASDRVYTVFVNALSYDTDRAALIEYFSSCGEIVRLSMPAGDGGKTNKGFAFVEFANADGPTRAVQLATEEVMLHGRVPRIRDDSASGDAAKPRAMRVEKLTPVCHWDILHHWEEIDMETVSLRPSELFREYDIGLQVKLEETDIVPVKTSGGSATQPIQTFEDAHLPLVLLQNVYFYGFQTPTPIQCHAIPTILSHQDLIACSQTGSGKTAAFALPLIAQLLAQGPSGPTSRSTVFPSVLILSPTRELAKQLETEFRKLAFNTFIKVASCYGGVTYEEADAQLLGSHIVVATPGRLIDRIHRRQLSLAYVRALVVDEADRLLDMGFEPALRQIVMQEDLPDRNHRQSLMFSATFSSHIQTIARTFLRLDHCHITVGEIGTVNLNIEQHFIYCTEFQKHGKIVELLDQTNDGMALVFTERKSSVVTLEKYLSNLGFTVASLHGDKRQSEREKALQEFRTGQKTVLVATDVASRGLDIQNISHVINCDMPALLDDYVHRIGRTARAGRKGRATSLFTDNDLAIAKPLSSFLERQGIDVPDWLVNVAKERVIRDENYAAWDRLNFERDPHEHRVYASVTVVGSQREPREDE